MQIFGIEKAFLKSKPLTVKLDGHRLGRFAQKRHEAARILHPLCFYGNDSADFGPLAGNRCAGEHDYTTRERQPVAPRLLNALGHNENASTETDDFVPTKPIERCVKHRSTEPTIGEGRHAAIFECLFVNRAEELLFRKREPIVAPHAVDRPHATVQSVLRHTRVRLTDRCAAKNFSVEFFASPFASQTTRKQ